MATLHVRNVPDALYEALRRSADANGRSIGAEAIQLIEQALTTEPARRPRLETHARRRSGFRPFQRFTPRARAAVVAAQDEARALGHGGVGTGHLLLGLLAIGEGAACAALEALGLTAERVRGELQERQPRAPAEQPGVLAFEPGTKKAFELALREALELGHDYIGTEHLLLGIVREGETAGAAIVRFVEADEEVVRNRVMRALSGPAGASSMPWPPPGVHAPFGLPEQEFLVVELEGSAEEWQTHLNKAGIRGFDLVEVVGTRAIFRRG